jgi:tripeptide aminopeptidase
MERLVKRFIAYTKIDTQSDHHSGLHPSTEKQKNLGLILVDELKSLGLHAFMDDYGYVYSKLEKNVENKPAIGFIAHMDTSPDAPGENVNPRIIQNYQGELIHLNAFYQMGPKEFPSLSKVIGDDIIVTDGNTLLGADDKLGIAEIMEMVTYFTLNKDKPHGDIYICFTPDEEIGEGTNFFNYDFFKADFAYTSDGGDVSTIEYENFNAANAILDFTGKSIHPGTAKNKMIHSVHLAFEFHQMLPTFLNPAYTEGYEGFNHLTEIKGEVEKTHVKYIIRNHDMALFNAQKNEMIRIQNYLNEKYGYQAVNLEIKDSYFNMKEMIVKKPDIIELAVSAIKKVGLTPRFSAIRGGTDGARLTYEGLPCPNIGTGGFQYHGRMEFASINQMRLAVQILIEIVNLS